MFIGTIIVSGSCLLRVFTRNSLSVACRLAVGSLLVTCRPTVDRQVFWGALLHNHRVLCEVKVSPDRFKVSSPSPLDAVSVASSSSCLLVFSFSTADLATISGLSLLQANIERTALRFNMSFFASGLMKSSGLKCSL